MAADFRRRRPAIAATWLSSSQSSGDASSESVTLSLNERKLPIENSMSINLQFNDHHIRNAHFCNVFAHFYIPGLKLVLKSKIMPRFQRLSNSKPQQQTMLRGR